MDTFAVWGCGTWTRRAQIVPAGEPMDCVTEDMPEWHLLPADFVREWGEELGSEHWAEIVACDEADLDAATRGDDNVYGWTPVTDENILCGLCRNIAEGGQDIDPADFQRRLSLPDGWDWDDVRALLEQGDLRAADVVAAVNAGLRLAA